MNQKKLLFIDRDGTLLIEPEDQQIDSLEKLQLVPGVIPALICLRDAGYRFIMVSNQDGLGTPSFPKDTFEKPQQFLLNLLQSQGIEFDAIHICPHSPSDNCDCRKPKLGLLMSYVIEQSIDRNHSYVIGDRDTDLQLAKNLGIQGLKISPDDLNGWKRIIEKLLYQDRCAQITRNTNETKITVKVNLDQAHAKNEIHSGIGFFDHMLEQLAKHGGFNLCLAVTGDLHVDDHHTTEDVGIALGQAIRKALGDKRGITRYGFILPMDEAQAQVSLDLSGRAYYKFSGTFNREQVGGWSTEMVSHFFHSLSDSLGANLHIDVIGENEHHMIEAIFKGVGRSLAQAFKKSGVTLPSTKGIL